MRSSMAFSSACSATILSPKPFDRRVGAHVRATPTTGCPATSPFRLHPPSGHAFLRTHRSRPGVPPPSGVLLGVRDAGAARAARAARRGAADPLVPLVPAPARIRLLRRAHAPVIPTPLRPPVTPTAHAVLLLQVLMSASDAAVPFQAPMSAEAAIAGHGRRHQPRGDRAELLILHYFHVARDP